MQLQSPTDRPFWPAIALLSSLLVMACSSDIDANPLAPDTSYAAQGTATYPIGTVHSSLDTGFILAGAQWMRAGELILLGTQQPNPTAQRPTAYQRMWIKLDAIGQAVSGWGVNGVFVQAPEPLQAQHLLQDAEARWLVVSRARMADGGLAVVVNRLRGDSQ